MLIWREAVCLHRKDYTGSFLLVMKHPFRFNLVLFRIYSVGKWQPGLVAIWMLSVKNVMSALSELIIMKREISVAKSNTYYICMSCIRIYTFHCDYIMFSFRCIFKLMTCSLIYENKNTVHCFFLLTTQPTTTESISIKFNATLAQIQPQLSR